MGSNRTYKLSHSKGNHKQKETYRIGEKFANDAINQGLISISKIYKQFI